jgi:hypothetical protein
MSFTSVRLGRELRLRVTRATYCLGQVANYTECERAQSSRSSSVRMWRLRFPENAEAIRWARESVDEERRALDRA